MHRGALEAALSTHCGTSSSAELWSDPALPHLCSCPGAIWCASASAPPLAPKLIKPWVLIPCSWMLGGRGGGGCYNSLTIQICPIQGTSTDPEDAEWIRWTQWERQRSGHEMHVYIGTLHVHDMQHAAIPAPVPQMPYIKPPLPVLHASGRPTATSCCWLRAYSQHSPHQLTQLSLSGEEEAACLAWGQEKFLEGGLFQEFKQ